MAPDTALDGRRLRVLMVTFPVASHLFPMVPLARALTASGHEVRVASHPSFRPVIASTGLDGVGVGREPDLGWVFAPGGVPPIDDPGATPAQAQQAARSLTMFAENAADMAADLVAGAAGPADLVVYEPRALAGVAAAHAMGVPAVRHLFGVDYTRYRWPVEAQILAPLLDRLGCGDADPHGDLTVDPCPQAMQLPWPAGAVQPMRYEPFNGDGTVPARLRIPGDRPRVCVCWGTTLARQSGQLEPAVAAIRAAAGLGAEVIVATTPDQVPLLGTLPDGVILLADSPPLSALLPGCAAIVHPGGSGTLLTAVAAGTPQVIVPALADQFLNAERYAATGAGLAADLTDGAAALTDAIGAVLADDRYSLAARDLATSATTAPEPAEVAARLANLLSVDHGVSSMIDGSSAHQPHDRPDLSAASAAT